MFRYFDCRCSTDGITARCADLIAGELVGDEHARHVPQALERAKHRRSEPMLTISAGRRRLRWIRVESGPSASAKVFEKLSALEG